MERLHGLARILHEGVCASSRAFRELIRHRYDVAATFLGVEDVEELSRARPKQLCFLGARRLSAFQCKHLRDGVHPVSAIRPAKTKTMANVTRIERIGHGTNLIQNEDRSHVQHHAFG